MSTQAPNSEAARIWFVTGATSGFGRALTEAVVAAGDVVVAASRHPEHLEDLATTYPDQLQPIQLDVADSSAGLAAIADVEGRYGHIDVLVNNAGRTHVGAVEETTEAELRSLFDLQFFGPAALTQAVLPGMRSRRSGGIVQLSSMGGQLSFAGFSAYSATKFALEGFSEALADEVTPFGIRVLVVEPGAFRTGLFANGSYSTTTGTTASAYAGSVGSTREMVKTSDGSQPGDPAKAAAAILRALAADRAPLRLPLGDDAVDAITAHLDTVRADLDTWVHLSRSTTFNN